MKSALLNKLRSKVEPLLSKLAPVLGRTGVSPNVVTLLSLITAITGVLATLSTRSGLVLGLTVLVSGFFDAVDGALARVQRRSSARGALLDSVADRVCEALFALGILALGLNPYVVCLFLALSSLTSYLRARGESLGVASAGVGLMERAERLISLLIIIAVYELAGLATANALLTIVVVLTGVTVVQRFLHIWGRV